MCVIAVKPKNVSMPDEDTIRAMWDMNPHGAGFMWADGKMVHIQKGFMTVESLLKALKTMEEKHSLFELPMVLHFRIGTAGGNTPENTHPFPVTDSVPLLQKLSVKTPIGVAHNGIIPIDTSRPDISDTMEYIAAQMTPLYRYDHEFYRSKDILDLISKATHSKWAIMNGEGDVVTIGEFYERNGILYSNLHHEWTIQNRYARYSCIGNGDGSFFWDPYDDDMEFLNVMLLPADACLYDEETNTFLEVGDNGIFMDEWGIPYVLPDNDCGDFIIAPLVEDARVYDRDMHILQFNPEKAYRVACNYNYYMSILDLVEPDDEKEENQNG